MGVDYAQGYHMGMPEPFTEHEPARAVASERLIA